VWVQLSATTPAVWAVAAGALIALAARPAGADGRFGTTTTFFQEGNPAGPLHMRVISPSVWAGADAGDKVTIEANYDVDVVSGASVAIVSGPSAEVDAISSATRVTDLRQTTGATLQLRGDTTSLRASYSYGFENDYRSHALTLSARAELFERNTAFELSYGRGFDRVCNLAQPDSLDAVDRQRMPTSEGCFGGDQRESLDLNLQTFQAGWTQAWTPILLTQLVMTTQVLHGYQANPYRAVFLGLAAAQEHHPETRVRYSGGLRMRLWLEPLRGALHLFGRLYRDTWAIRSVTADLAYEQTLGAGLRLRARGRHYRQSGAVFYSDDYVLFPRGQYFTGDRELSAMSSWTVGGQLSWTVPSGDDGKVLGFLGTMLLVAKADFLMFDFPDFHYGNVPVPNDKALVVTLGIDTVF
jgi:hypothetical protein